MATLTIRELDAFVEAQLRARAAEHGRTVEEEAREILRSVIGESTSEESPLNMAERIRQRFEPVGGAELQIRQRSITREPIDFSGPEYGTFGDE